MPTYCADCRRAGSRSTPRPASVKCERCGADVAVRDRGPLPRYCRQGCKTPGKAGSRSAPSPLHTAPAKTVSAETLPTGTATALRPWDRQRASVPGPSPVAAPAPPAPKSKPIRRVPPTTTRIDTVYPAVGTAHLNRAVKVARLRHAASIFAWIAVVSLIALIVFVGSRPAPIPF